MRSDSYISEQAWRSLIDAEHNTFVHRSLRAMLAGGSVPYRAVVAARNARFRLTGSTRLPVPVISVGNLTVGGTGKTPLVCHLARYLADSGRRPAVILRGYSRGPGGSDEATLLRAALGDQAIVAVGPDRVAVGRRLLEQSDADVVVLDDGYQHRRLHRDLDILLLDATCPFRRLRLLPRGVLREPLSQVRRADVVILTRAELADEDTLIRWRGLIERHSSAPILHARTRVEGLVGPDDAAIQTPSGPVVAFCGIGNPDAFLATLRRLGLDVVRFVAYGDHHAYTATDLDALARTAEQVGAAALVTTEKDWVKVKNLWDQRERTTTIGRVRISIDLGNGEAVLRSAVDAVARLTGRSP